mmetsp:Transcript_114564/g.330987  ORF Transcript_114564/g.330987 Transcript_114564/m.330987 type:complete len:221 (-) Transcript_114564:235-897(-)
MAATSAYWWQALMQVRLLALSAEAERETDILPSQRRGTRSTPREGRAAVTQTTSASPAHTALWRRHRGIRYLPQRRALRSHSRNLTPDCSGRRRLAITGSCSSSSSSSTVNLLRDQRPCRRWLDLPTGSSNLRGRLRRGRRSRRRRLLRAEAKLAHRRRRRRPRRNGQWGAQGMSRASASPASTSRMAYVREVSPADIATSRTRASLGTASVRRSTSETV